MSLETYLERFRRACGLGAPLSLAVEATDAPAPTSQPLEWPGPFLLVGRHPRDDLSLASRQVSRRHAYLQAVAGRLIGIDLKSRTSTFWDDAAEARPWGWLDPGRFIRIGPYRIHRTDRQPDEPAPLLDPFVPPDEGALFPEPVPRPAFELPFRVGGVASTWEMPGLLALVGRTDDCQFILADDSISRTHACLVRTPLGAWVVDLGARAGTGFAARRSPSTPGPSRPNRTTIGGGATRRPPRQTPGHWPYDPPRDRRDSGTPRLTLEPSTPRRPPSRKGSGSRASARARTPTPCGSSRCSSWRHSTTTWR